MNTSRRLSEIAFVGGAALVLLTVSRDARAQPTCDTTGSCSIQWNSGGGNAYYGIGQYAVGAVWGQDLYQGVGVTGFSASSGNSTAEGCGVLGGVHYPNSYPQPSGYFGVYGYGGNSGDYGGYFKSPGTGGTGSYAALYGNATATGGTGVLGTGFAYGVYGSSVNAAYGVGVYGTNNQNNGSGVSGNNTAGGYGVYAQSSSGDALYATSTSGYGVYAYSNSNNAIVGTSTSLNAVYGSTAAEGASGGYFQNTGSGGNDVGVAGVSTNNYGGWFITTNGSFAAYFNTDIKIGNTCYGPNCSGSDQRLKKNIEPLAGALDKLLKVNGVTYEWQTPDDQHPTGRQTGVIAQDVEKVFPEWVGERRDGMKVVNIDQREMLGVTVEAFRTLKAENDLLKERVAALESGRRPLAAGFNLNGVGFGMGGLAIAGALFISRRKAGGRGASTGVE